MKLVLFCDYGLDDAAATYDALSHAIADGYEEVHLVAVAGNVPAAVSLVNAKKLVAHCDFARPTVYIVDTTDEKQPAEYLKDIHGNDGMGDLFPIKEPRNVRVVKFSDWLARFSGEYDFLSLGPMTLVPALLKKARPRRFIFMGGNIAEIPNFRGYEFNHALNRCAFSECAKFVHVAVTMDTCRHPLFNIQQKEIAGEDIPHRIVRRSRELTFRSGEVGCYVWDDVAVKALRHPEWFETEVRTDQDGNELIVAKYIYGKEYLEILED